MFNLFQTGGIARRVAPRHLVCLLLALTFLYNPFLGASSPVKYPSISHPPSFRATVASSELLKFKPKEGGEVQVDQKEEVVLLDAATPAVSDNFGTFEIADARVFVRLLPAGKLWFRPPPVA